VICKNHLASQGKANVNSGEDSEGKSKLSVTDIPEAEDSVKGEIVKFSLQ
jgi:hypothetical protein